MHISVAWLGTSAHSPPTWSQYSQKCAESNAPEAFLHADEGRFDTDTESSDDDVEDDYLGKLVNTCIEDPDRWNDVRQKMHQCYMVVKRRWRKLMGRPTRNKRRMSRRAPRGKGKGKGKSFLCTQCSSHYDVMEQSEDLVSVFIANKGKRKRKRL